MNDAVEDASCDALAVVERMIEEVLGRGRKLPMPTGGAKQAPFDGEELGDFIRYAVLCEVRAEINGVEPDYEGDKERFMSRR